MFLNFSTPEKGQTGSVPATPSLLTQSPCPLRGQFLPRHSGGHMRCPGCREGLPGALAGTERPPACPHPSSPTSSTSPRAKHFITGSPARQRGWKWPCWRKPRRASQTSALEASGPWPDHAELARWGVYGNVGPEASPAAGLGSPEAPPGSECQLGRGHQRLQLRPCFPPPSTWGSGRLGSPGLSEWQRQARSSDRALSGHCWKVATTRESVEPVASACVQILAVPLTGCIPQGSWLTFWGASVCLSVKWGC